jgi:hypothetical protein
LHCPSGELAVVASVKDVSPAGGARVYNFEVAHDHTYFVKAHAPRGPPIGVHNADGYEELMEGAIETFNGYRVMVREEYMEASQGIWQSLPYTETPGLRLLWADENPAREWLELMRRNGEDAILTIVPLAGLPSDYVQWLHFTPTGVVIEAPLHMLGAAIEIP